jgi:hypothetical protein
MKDNTQSNEVKQHIIIVNPLESKDDKSIVFNSEIFDTEENDTKKIKQQQIIKSKFNKNKFILKKKSKTKILPQKRSSIDEPNRSLKKIKITEESLNNTFNENVISPKVDNQQSIPVDNKEELTLKIDEIGTFFFLFFGIDFYFLILKMIPILFHHQQQIKSRKIISINS